MELKTSEFFKNMKSLPPDEDSPEFKELIDWEIEKCTGGITVDGVYISGWLYWHTNHWWIRLDEEDEFGNIVRVPCLPDLRDNEWERAEHLEKCRLEKKGYIEVGARQGGKSEFLASFSAYNTILFQNTQNVIIASNSNDLDLLKDKIDFGLKSLWKGISIPRLDKTWRGSQIRLGYKEKDGEDKIWSHLIIRNTDDGKNTEVSAGTTAKSFVMDEIGKAPFAKAYTAAKPAFMSKFGMRAIPMLLGCVCAGTKVWDNQGNLLNIEDLIPENGILGYNGTSLSKEEITYWQPPEEKSCYKITTNTGRTLECSEDHPILCRERDRTTYNKELKRSFRKIHFKEARDIKIGEHIAIIEEIDLFGNKEMWEPRVVGWLIGDGSYGFDKTPVMSNCDEYINNYIEEKFDTKTEKSYITKLDKVYKETRIKNICPILRDLGIYGQTKLRKTLPTNIHSYSKINISELIGGLFDTDGSVNARKSVPSITLTSASDKLLLEIQLLLQKFGIHGGVRRVKANPLTNSKNKNDWFTLSISDSRSIISFYKNIHFTLSYKQELLELAYTKSLVKRHKVPKEVEGIRIERVVNIENIGLKPVYNLTAGTTNTYIANGIITHNTGGAFEKGQDAERFFYHPEANDFLGVPNPVTGKSTGLFLSGIFRQDCKVKTTLSQFLRDKKGLTIPKDSDLDNITIWVGDEQLAREKILAEREQKKKDPDQAEYLKVIMYNPLTPEECFMRKSTSIFNTVAAKTQQQKVYNNNIRANNIFLTHDGEKIGFEYAKEHQRPISHFPHTQEDDLDAPIQVWEFPKDGAPDGLYVMGVDPYRHMTSKYSKSLGAAYVFKRINSITSENEYQYRFVASYVARPDDKNKWNEQVRLLAKWYNARVLCERDEMSFIDYMKYKGDGRYLEKQLAFVRELHPNTTVPKDYGIHSTPQIIEFRDGCLKRYMDEVLYQEKDEEGSVLKELTGTTCILDPMLLEEIIKHDPDDKDFNADRLVAAGLALTLAYSLDPVIGTVKAKNEKIEALFNRKPQRTLFKDFSSLFKTKGSIKKLFK